MEETILPPSYRPSWVQSSLPPEGGGEADEVRVWFLDRPAWPHGGSWTPNTSESRNVAYESLSSVLEPAESIPPQYYLSPKACAGILRRAEKRGKVLPPVLQRALKRKAA